MSGKDNGGPVYPYRRSIPGADKTICVPGITRRDDLAKNAMVGILSNPEMTEDLVQTIIDGKEVDKDEQFYKRIAKTAYKVAEAMIVEGKKGIE